MPTKTAPIAWDSEAVAKRLKAKGIRNREQFSRRFKLPRTTVYRQFDEDWNGNPTHTFLAAVSDALGVSATRLIVCKKAA